MCLTAVPQARSRSDKGALGGGVLMWGWDLERRGRRGHESYRKGRDRRLSRAGVVAGSIPTASRTPVSMVCSFNSLKQHTHTQAHTANTF